MAGILVYALHDDEGNFNKNSLGALSEAAKLAAELGTESAAVVVGDVSDEGAQGLGNYGVTKVYRAKNVPEGLAQPIVDVMAKVITDNGFSYALFGGGLLGCHFAPGPALHILVVLLLPNAHVFEIHLPQEEILLVHVLAVHIDDYALDLPAPVLGVLVIAGYLHVPGFDGVIGFLRPGPELFDAQLARLFRLTGAAAARGSGQEEQ